MEGTWVLGLLAVALLVASQSTRVRAVDGRLARVLLAAAAVLFVGVAFARADSGSQFLQFTVLGIAFGSVYAIAAAGLVLTYTTTGVFNFAHGALGMISAFVYWQLTEKSGVPDLLAVVLVLGVLGPLMGLLLELMFRRFRDADVGTSIVLTIAVTVLCIGVAQYAFKATEAHNLPRLLGNNDVTFFDATITYDDILRIVLAIAIAVGLRILLFRSRTGTAMRAVVDNANLAALNGASPSTIARISWVLGTELAVVAGILVGAGSNLEAITLTFFVVNAYGAAVFGKLRSLPLTFAGGIVLGIVQNWGPFTFPNEAHSFDLIDTDLWRRINVSLPGIFLFLALLALPQAKLTVGRVVGRKAPAVPSLPSSVARGVLFVASMGFAVQAIPEDLLADATRGLIFALILLSLVLLTGFSGQVSLTQYVFVALGAWAMGKTFGGDSIVGMLAAGLVAVPIGAIVALPALRLQGLYLALVTYGFASVSQLLVIQDPRIYGRGAVNVGRLELPGLSFEGNKAFFVLCALVFAVMAIAVLALKRGPFGRRLAALRDSQAACATLGLDIRRTKLAVFCMSAFIAGVAGSLFGGLQSSVSDISIEPINNIVLFLFAVVGGITTVSGAFIGGALFALLPYVQSKQPELAGLVFAGVAAVAIGLGRQPNGLAGILVERVDRFLGRNRPSGAVVDTTTPAAPSSPSSVPITQEVAGATA
jgi:branched-chain amino acid transport system permease protein